MRHNQVVALIEGHLDNIRLNPWYKNAHIFVFIEANYGGWWSADVVRKVVEQPKYAPLEACRYDETADDRVGVWMRDELKDCMAGDMQRSLGDGQWCWAKDFISWGKKAKDIQKELCEQLANYRKEIVPPTDEATGKWKAVITGKSAGRKDDLAIVAQIALYFSGKKRLEPGFRDLAERYGWRY